MEDCLWSLGEVINSQRWWYMGHDRLSMEGWKTVCGAWVKLLIAKDGGTWVMIGCRWRDGRLFVKHG